jgi:hypothetical protein
VPEWLPDKGNYVSQRTVDRVRARIVGDGVSAARPATAAAARRGLRDP